MIPFKRVFLGVGKGDPEKDPDDYPHDPAGKYGPQGKNKD
jgi:hypothetical protein